MARLFGRVGDTLYATMYGTLAVSAVRGLLGGLMFWWLGLSAPLLWRMERPIRESGSRHEAHEHPVQEWKWKRARRQFRI